MKIQTPAVITSISSRQDKSLRLSIETPELSSEEKAAFMDIQGLNTTILITPEDEKGEVMSIDTKLDGKSPSERLRAVLFVFWKQIEERKDSSLEKREDFESWYRRKMDRIIEDIKSKLNPHN